jgi:hypothetical protein
MYKVTFQCKRSGNFVSFTNENDIAGLRKHEGYNEVIQNGNQEEIGQEAAKEVLTLKRGRPKAVVPAFLQE